MDGVRSWWVEGGVAEPIRDPLEKGGK